MRQDRLSYCFWNVRQLYLSHTLVPCQINAVERDYKEWDNFSHSPQEKYSLTLIKYQCIEFVITLVKKIFMAEAGKKPHGNKKYYHVLIDINRGELFDEYIRTKLKIKPTSWIRDVVYKFLQDKIDKEVYDEALKKDQENWNRAIQNRLQGRALSRILNSIKKKNE